MEAELPPPVPSRRLSQHLSRRLGTGDAVVIGLGSMMGAGVFVVWAPAARAAGAGLLIGLVLAAAIAYCNAAASAQLAAVYPVSGGTYVYAREQLSAWWGFVAGWGFVIGKTASCAAIAITFASYAVQGPAWAQRVVAAASVGAIAALNYRGLTRTAQLTRWLVACTLVTLIVFVVATLPSASSSSAAAWTSASPYGVLQAAGLIFFAFAGYARIATMGEEVRDPRRTIPRAIVGALGLATIVYFVVGACALLVGGPQLLASSTSPLAAVLSVSGHHALTPVVRIGAAVASLGALVALMAGIGRTVLAMAREGDLPVWLARVHPRFRVPHRAEVVLAAVVIVLVLATDLRGAIGFSSFGVLVYYAIANVSAFTQPSSDRRWPRWLNVLGVVGCLVLAFALPIVAVVVALAVFGVGLVGRWMRLRGTQPPLCLP